MSQVILSPLSQNKNKRAKSNTASAINGQQLKVVIQTIVSFAFPITVVGISIANDNMYSAQLIPASLIIFLVALVRLLGNKE